MSDNTPTDAAKPARKPRKSAPRRRKPTAKTTDATSAVDNDAALAPAAVDAPMPTAPAPHATVEPVTSVAASARAPRVRDDKRAPSPAPRQATPPPSAAPVPRVLIRVPLSVRWRDLDAFNHVNNSKFLSYLEEARLQWMLGMPGQGLDDHVAPVVAAANLNYRRPIEWPNELMVELFVERLGNTSVTIGHRIIARDDASVLFCDGNVVMVWIDRGTGAAAPLPAEVRAACR